MESDLITRSQIAERLGVSRVRVQQLTGKSGFPEPAGTVGRAVAYREKDVAAWALGRGRRYRVDGSSDVRKQYVT